MTRIAFLFLLMCSFTSSYSQKNKYVEGFLAEEERNYTDTDLDNAFAAPVSKFVGKKWYQGWWSATAVRYWIFNNDKTGAIVKEVTDDDYTAPVQVVMKNTFRWKRSGNDLTITLTPHLDVAFPVESSMSKLSPRVKADVKKDYATVQSKMREKTYSDYNMYGRIAKITNDMFIITLRGGDNFFGVSKKRFDEIIRKVEEEEQAAREKEEQAAREKEEQAAREKEKAEQEERARREKERAEQEERARREEIQKKLATTRELNSQAYSYLRQGQFDEAIATIDKAIELLPDNADIYDSKGEILYMKGDKEMAKAMWEKAFSLDPKIADPERGSALNWLVNKKGWHSVTEDFPYNVPFKKIRVLKQKWSKSQYCCAFFSTEPNSSYEKSDTNFGVNFYEQIIVSASSQIKFKKCTDVGDGWVEYEFSKPVYFSHYQQNAPKDRLKILIE